MSDIRPHKTNVHFDHGLVLFVSHSIHERRMELPVIVDDHGQIVAGLVQFLVAEALGLKSIPVHYVEGLTAKQAEEYRLRDGLLGPHTWYDDNPCPRVHYPAPPINSLAIADEVLSVGRSPKREPKARRLAQCR
jgi:hypothetical protein